MTKTRLCLFLFLGSLFIRLLVAYQGNFDYHIGDSPKYIAVAESILNGNPSFILNNGLFVAAPIYPLFIAGCRLVFGENYILAIQIIQILCSSITDIFIFLLCMFLFGSQRIGIFAAVLFGLLPMGIFFTFKVAQETFFTTALVISIYYLVRVLNDPTKKHLFLSAVFFSIAFLIKSLIGLFSPFIILSILVSRIPEWRKKILFSVIYTVICFVFTLPYGLYNLQKLGIYTFSSTGPGCVVYFGNTEMQYRFVVETPPKNSPEYLKLLSMDFSFANGSSYDALMLKPINERERFFYIEAYKWARANPYKFLILKIESAKLFLTPSVSKKHYPFKTWLFSLVTIGPVYLLAYIGIFVALRRDFRQHSWAFWLFISLFVFSVVCGSVSRYRTAMLEPFYIIYAAYAFQLLCDRWFAYKHT